MSTPRAIQRRDPLQHRHHSPSCHRSNHLAVRTLAAAVDTSSAVACTDLEEGRRDLVGMELGHLGRIGLVVTARASSSRPGVAGR